MVGEVNNMNLTMKMKYYGSEKYPIVHFPFNFEFVVANDYFTSIELHEKITGWLENMPKHGVANWVVSEALHSLIKTDKKIRVYPNCSRELKYTYIQTK